jgi:hypothetical protein
LLLCVLVYTVGCNGALRVQAPELTAIYMDASAVTVYWEQNPTIESHADFQGYNIYVYTDSSALLVENGEELNKWNTQVIEDTSFLVNGLPQDSIYFFQVRTVNTDDKVGDYNGTTPFVRASTRPEFTVTLRIADLGLPANDSCALRFADGSVMADSMMVDSAADMWARMANDTLYIVSPDGHPNFGTGARSTFFTNAGPGDFSTTNSVTTEPDLGELVCNALDIVVAKTEDSNYAKIYVESIDMQNGVVTLLFAYQNIAEFPYF